MTNSEQRYQALLQFLRPALWTVNAAGVVTEVGPGAEDLTGRPAEAWLGQVWTAVASELGLRADPELSFAGTPASWPTVAGHAAQIGGPEGDPRRITLTVQPATAEGPALILMAAALAPSGEAPLGAASRRYATLLDTLVAAVIVIRLDGTIVDCNPTACAMFGYERQQLLGSDAQRLVTSEANRAIPNLTDPGLRTTPVTVEGEGRRQGGELFPLEVSLRTVDLDGELLVVAHVLDITERQQVRLALERAQRFAERILEATPDLVYIHDLAADKAIYANPGALRLLGYTDEQVAGFGPGLFQELMHPEDHEVGRARLARLRAAADAGVSGITFRLRDARGQWRIFSSREVPFQHPSGDYPTHVLGTAKDVTDQVRSERALQESTETAWALLNATHDVAILLDIEGAILGLNESMAEFLGRPAGELVGANIVDHLPEELGDVYRRRLAEVVAAGEPRRYEDEVRGRQFDSVCSPITGPDGTVTRVAIFVHDITERRRAEAAQRLATIGQLAAGLAHEFNNILVSLMLAAESAGFERTPEEYEGLVDVVLRNSRRGADICKNLMAFAKPRQPRRQAIYVEEPIEGTLALMGRQMEGAGITVQREYHSAGRRMLGDPAQLEQVFLNLIINACHAMPHGGTLTVRTTCADGGEAGLLTVELADTGRGIPPEHLGRIFEPFFTTKGRLGQSEVPGTGLGLSVSHGIVASHGGAISVVSEEGRGTTFTLRFAIGEAPVLEEGADETPFRPPPQVEPGRRVLLAEDEADVRQGITQMLTTAGYCVTSVAAADDAIVLLERDDFDLVITDLLMPGGGGKAVLARLQRREAPPPVLVVTGHDQGCGEEDAGTLRVRCLVKPFLRDALLGAVAELLEA